ncbi:hypothetical protein PLESTB_000660500 [Pleodorina starrii]|uniref:Acyl-CoA dehydrogenase n=1 Tax=Pleodorina starrii TaxID=330485 RepID=A0A9W6BJG5_9CHLO|nr:hypothetical protein PLESTM_001320000 [Pleodorina starrii]GLC52717.1 hypothetical protein PLESTB_000660500 [Pleodorina starrii]
MVPEVGSVQGVAELQPGTCAGAAAAAAATTMPATMPATPPAAVVALAPHPPSEPKKSLAGLFEGALSGLAGVVAQAAAAAGMEALAGSLAEAAEARAVSFDQALGGEGGEDGGGGGGGGLPSGRTSQLVRRLRSGVRRSLSRSRRMRFEEGQNGGEGEDVPEGLHFLHTEAQRRLRAEATAFVTEAAEPSAVRQREAAGQFPREALAAAARRGYGRLLLPRSVGGLGLGMDSSCGLMEAVGGSDLPLAALLAAHNAVAYLLATYGTSKLHEKLVRQLGALASLGALAVSESPGGSDMLSTLSFAEKDVSGQFYTLSGNKAWVAGGQSADVFLLLARTSVEPRKGLSLFAITKNMPGVCVGAPADLSGWRSCPVAPLSLSRVVVRTEYLLGREGQGVELLDLAHDLLRTWLAAAAVSYGEAVLQLAVETAAAAEASSGPGGALLAAFGGGDDGGGDDAGGFGFGSGGGGGGGPMGRQIHQMELVRAKTQLQAARLMVRAAAQQLDCKAPNAGCDASVAKIYAVRAAQRAAETAVRMLGRDAVRPDLPVHGMLSNLHAADFVAGPPDALYGTVFSEMYRMSAT